MEQLAFLKRILAISGAGLTYGRDKFDLERYQQLQNLATAQLAEVGEAPIQTVQQLFENESGYPTPKVDVRAFIKRDDQVLLVEDGHGKWALPGGFAEVGWSARENVAKEVQEETGLKVTVGELRAIYDTNRRPDIPQIFQYYKLIFAATAPAGNFVHNSETIAMAWFKLTELPPLSLKRTTPEQVQQLFTSGNPHID